MLRKFNPVYSHQLTEHILYLDGNIKKNSLTFFSL